MAKLGSASIPGLDRLETRSPLTGKLGLVSHGQRLTIMSEVLDVASGGAARSIRITPRNAKSIEVQLDRVVAGLACVGFLLYESPSIRRAFVAKLGETVWRERGPLLSRVVQDPDRHVRQTARELLRKLNWPVDTVVSGLEMLQPEPST
jgi:hypothetical protein